MNKCDNCTTLSCTLTTVYNLSILFTKQFASQHWFQQWKPCHWVHIWAYFQWLLLLLLVLYLSWVAALGFSNDLKMLHSTVWGNHTDTWKCKELFWVSDPWSKASLWFRRLPSPWGWKILLKVNWLIYTVFFNLVSALKSVLTDTPLVVLYQTTPRVAGLRNVWEAISMNVPPTLVVKG